MYKWRSKEGYFTEILRKAEEQKAVISRQKYCQADAYKILDYYGGKYNRFVRMDDYLEKMDFEICEL